MKKENIVFSKTKFDIRRLKLLQERPLPFTPGEPLFWNDPYISQQMLAAHLDPNMDAASRQPETIARSVDWMVKELNLQPGASILDLGCGPGLYASHLAVKGFSVTGVDYSQRSIDYARQYAQENHLEINYRFLDYLTLEDEFLYDAALLIYGDYCPLSPDQRKMLLSNVQRALKPGGQFVLDVSRQDPANLDRSKTSWYVSGKGFWRPCLHLVLEQTFSYPEQALQLDQYSVIEDTGTLTTYRVWRQEYTQESITDELAAGGFNIRGFWGDLTGIPDTEASEWIGITALKK